VDKWLVQYALELDLSGELFATQGKTNWKKSPRAPKLDGKPTRGGLGAGGDQVRGFGTMAARAALGRRGVPARAFVGLLRVFL
jgi:hypothetical protein